MCAAVRGSTWETWLKTRMQPPVAGIFSPSIQVRLVVASRVGLMIGTARLKAQPRFSCSGRTVTCILQSCHVRGRLLCPCAGQATRSRPSIRRPPSPDRIGSMSTPSYVVLLPVKPPARGKSRLDVDPARRRALAAAFALDTARACLEAARVRAVLAVTDDAAFADDLRAAGCVTIPDGVAGDLNESLRQAAAEARRRWPRTVPVAVC